MVPYIRNLDLFEDYPRAVEDNEYNTEDHFTSYKRYSVPHIDDIIFRMSYDADFYAMLDPQSALSLGENGGHDFVVEPESQRPAYDYPHEAAGAVDEDWYLPHPDLGAVLARVENLQMEDFHGGSNGTEGFAQLTGPDVPFDATAFQPADVCTGQTQQSETGLEGIDSGDVWTGRDFDTRLLLLFPSTPRQNEPFSNNDDEAATSSRIPSSAKHSSNLGGKGRKIL